MKRFKDLTELEIKDLNYDDLQKYILVECAENGVGIVDCPPEPTYEAEIERDEVCYRVGGYPLLYCIFSDADEATRLVDFLNSLSTMKDKNASSFYSVEKRLEYSDKAQRMNEEVQNRNKAIKADYLKQRETYDAYIDGRAEFAELINDKYATIKEKYERLDMIKRKYNETYLPLADNDETIAKRFLRDAFSISGDDEQYIFA